MGQQTDELKAQKHTKLQKRKSTMGEQQQKIKTKLKNTGND
jgi:hypothetical protein